jgi:amino acid transporter
MKLPPTMQPDQQQPENTPLLRVSQSTENEKGKKSSYVDYTTLIFIIFIIFFIVGIVLIIISKLNEQNQDNNVHLMIARDETAMKDAKNMFIAGIVLVVVGFLGIGLEWLYEWLYPSTI